MPSKCTESELLKNGKDDKVNTILDKITTHSNTLYFCSNIYSEKNWYKETVKDKKRKTAVAMKGWRGYENY